MIRRTTGVFDRPGGAAPRPQIAAWLFAAYRSPCAIAISIAPCALITLVATALMTDCTRKDISGEYPAREYQAETPR
jgi:hypothetical protein